MDRQPLIAIFCNSFPPEVGGASSRIYNLALLLRNAGYRVRVTAAMPNYPTGKIFQAYRGRLVRHEVVDGIQVTRVWMMPSNSASVFRRGMSMISFVLSLRMQAYRAVYRAQPQLVIVSSPPLPMAADAVRYFRKRGLKVLLNVSDIWPLSASALNAVQERSLYRLLQQQERHMYNKADAFTAQSEATLRHIRNVARLHRPMLLYRNLPAGIRAVPSSPPEQPVRIIYPGLIGHAQGLFELCRQVDFAARNATLHIYGAGAELPMLRDWVASHARCNIYLHEPVSPDVLAQMLPGFHAMLVPLIAPIEGALPSKLFTAMQAGLPVLYSGGDEGADIVRTYDLGWIAAPGDYEAISKNIAALSAQPSAAHDSMRQHIHEVCMAVFNKQEQDSRLLRFIREMLPRNR